MFLLCLNFIGKYKQRIGQNNYDFLVKIRHIAGHKTHIHFVLLWISVKVQSDSSANIDSKNCKLNVLIMCKSCADDCQHTCHIWDRRRLWENTKINISWLSLKAHQLLIGFDWLYPILIAPTQLIVIYF